MTDWASQTYGADLTADGIKEFAARLAELGFLEPDRVAPPRPAGAAVPKTVETPLAKTVETPLAKTVETPIAKTVEPADDAAPTSGCRRKRRRPRSSSPTRPCSTTRRSRRPSRR